MHAELPPDFHHSLMFGGGLGPLGASDSAGIGVLGQGLMPLLVEQRSPGEAGWPVKGSTVFPRRKAGQDRKDARTRPVTITLDLLDSFCEISLTEAAKKLGISSTAMKKACRKVGVKRWPYRKNAEESVTRFNEAYVRRIHRKYASAKARAPEGAPAPGYAGAAKEEPFDEGGEELDESDGDERDASPSPAPGVALGMEYDGAAGAGGSAGAGVDELLASGAYAW